MASGYTPCPCCGYDTVSDDVDEPELCSYCEEAGCSVDGEDPHPGCPMSHEDYEGVSE